MSRPNLAGFDTVAPARLAQQLDGVVYAPDDGFFDAQLQRICEL